MESSKDKALLSVGLAAALGVVVGMMLGNPWQDRLSGARDMHAIMEEETDDMGHAMDDMLSGLEGKEGAAFDRAFAEEMIVHHEGAVEMAELALVHAGSEEVKALARAIIAAQEAEIELMHGWLAAWKK